MAGQPTTEQMALLKPYEYHWTVGSYFTISIVAVSVACLYIFFLFHLGTMLRDKHVKDNGHPNSEMTTAANTMMNQNKRSSWSSRGSGRTRPTTRVMQALKTKKISAPSPIPEEYDDYENAKKSPGSSESGMDYSTAEGSGSGSGGHGTMPRLAFDEDMRPPRRHGELF